MPTPFNVSGGSSNGGGGGGGGGGGSSSQNSSSHLQNFNVEIDHDDPSKLFTDLTEIGHGNFGAVYYVI
jgi:hypothetical protein